MGRLVILILFTLGPHDIAAPTRKKVKRHGQDV